MAARTRTPKALRDSWAYADDPAGATELWDAGSRPEDRART